MRVGRRGVLLVLLGVAVTACRGADPAPARPVDERALDAATLASLPILALAEATTLCADSDDGCAFRQPLGAAESPEGALAVIDGMSPAQLYLVPPGGGAPRPLGRGGDGPGEYRILHAVGFDSAGGVLAYGMLNRRLVRYDAVTGRSETHQLPLPPTYLDAALVGGRVLAVANPGGAAGDSAEVGVYALEPGARAGRLLRPLGARDVTFPLDAMREMPGLFAPTTRWALAPDGAV